MGKRKRATKPPPKKKTAKLDRVFDCPFCGHEKSVDCVIERDVKVGKVECRVCGVKYKSTVHHLEEEIDVYSKWIDALDDVNADKREDEPEENDDVGDDVGDGVGDDVGVDVGDDVGEEGAAEVEVVDDFDD